MSRQPIGDKSAWLDTAVRHDLFSIGSDGGEVSTGSGSDRVRLALPNRVDSWDARSLPLPVLTSSLK